MCEHDDFDEFARRGKLSRRTFGAMALNATLAAMLPRSADAAATAGEDVEIKTPDGVADAYVVHPQQGPGTALLEGERCQ